MSCAAQIIHEAETLPVEDRTLIVDSLLRSLNRLDDRNDQRWVEVAKNRLLELRSGKIRSVPGDEVFARIRQRFAV